MHHWDSLYSLLVAVEYTMDHLGLFCSQLVVVNHKRDHWDWYCSLLVLVVEVVLAHSSVQAKLILAHMLAVAEEEVDRTHLLLDYCPYQ
jgi:hypothetical protein